MQSSGHKNFAGRRSLEKLYGLTPLNWPKLSYLLDKFNGLT